MKRAESDRAGAATGDDGFALEQGDVDMLTATKDFQEIQPPRDLPQRRKTVPGRRKLVQRELAETLRGFPSAAPTASTRVLSALPSWPRARRQRPDHAGRPR